MARGPWGRAAGALLLAGSLAPLAACQTEGGAALPVAAPATAAPVAAAAVAPAVAAAPPSPVVPAVPQPVMAALPPAPAAATGPSEPAALTFVAVGDVMAGTQHWGSDWLNPAITPIASPRSLLDPALVDILAGADVTFGNLEGVLWDGNGPTKRCGENCYVFRSPAFYADVYAGVGFDLMSMANNHAGDFLAEGRTATMDALDRAGLVYAGVDGPRGRTGSLTTAGGIRVGFAAFAPNVGTVQLNDHAGAAAIVRDLAAGHDVVVVSFHGGAEGAGHTHVPRIPELFLGENRGDVYAFARAVIDAGADVVVGHGPHVPRGVEVYNGRFIAYSLGNFWTYKGLSNQGLAGVAPVLELGLAADGRVVAARIHSARQIGDGVPQMDGSHEAARVIGTLSRQDFPDSPLDIDATGRVAGLPAAPGVAAAE